MSVFETENYTMNAKAASISDPPNAVPEHGKQESRLPSRSRRFLLEVPAPYHGCDALIRMRYISAPWRKKETRTLSGPSNSLAALRG
jgi:hypothetical protein